MWRASEAALAAGLAAALSGCGLGVSQLTEPWERSDPYVTGRMEMQIKQAIFCELRQGAVDARALNKETYTYKNKDVTSADDIALPETWGAQVTLTLTADEKSALTPNVMLKYPLLPDKAYGSSVSQNFNMGFGATASSQNVRYDKFSFYYTMHDLIDYAGPDDTCHHRPSLLGDPTFSSLFVDGRQLGIREWLPQATAVTMFQRSSRVNLSGEGKVLGASGSFTPDAITYDNKFVIITDGSATPTWNLMKIGTGSTPLIDFNRTRTHELLITIGPGDGQVLTDPKTKKKIFLVGGPSAAAASAHLASEIGSAVSAAIGNR